MGHIMKNNIMRYVTLSLIFLALFPTRLAAEDIDQRTLEDPHLLPKKCLLRGPDYIDNHCAFDLNVVVLREVSPYGHFMTIRADSKVEIRPPFKSGEKLSLVACPHPKKYTELEGSHDINPDGSHVFTVTKDACR